MAGRAMESRPRFFLFSLLFLASAAISSGHIAEYDEFWKKKAELARAAARSIYNPDPEAEVITFNEMVMKDLRKNTTRRELRGKKKTGPCLATNPIDRCWRCKKNWESNRKQLTKCVKGFGRHTTGGKKGNFYVVTDGTDKDLVNPKKGTLRYGVIQDRPLWIIFSRDMIIRLTEELIINSNKTIDARGHNVRIVGGAGLTIQYVHNVIISNLHIHDIKASGGGMIRDSQHHYGLRTRSDGDGISIFAATNVWIDHVSMSNCMDGLIDIIQGSTGITISNSHFTQHNDVMLFGASDAYKDDAVMQITVAFNHFGRGLVQRMPRCRWGFFHVVNNDYTHWMMYAIGGSQHPTIISQGNRFVAPPTPFAKEITKRDYAPESVWKQWTWRSEGDLLQNGAYFRQSGTKLKKKYSQKDMIQAKPGTYVARLTRHSGALDCFSNKPC